MLGNDVDQLLRAAVECSVFVSPRDYGLTDAELQEVAKRAGFKQGETRDSIGRLWPSRRLGQKRLMPSQHSRVLDGDFNFIIDPDHRSVEAFEFVRTDLIELAREVGEKAAFRSRDEIVERGSAAGHKQHDLDVAISILLYTGILEEKEGRIGHAAHKLRWPLPSAQIEQSRGRMPSVPAPGVQQAFPIVNDVMRLREADVHSTTLAGTTIAVGTAVVGGVAKSKEKSSVMATDSKKVFVIHGRNERAVSETGIFLRSMGLEPVLFRDVRKAMGGTAFIAKVVERGMEQAQGVLALFTPDEFSVLRPDLRKAGESGEKVARWQARPNVQFEAGMAYGRDPDRVAFVLFGDVKLFTDAGGIHVFWPANEYGPDSYRAQLRGLLAGGMNCAVNMHSDDWMTAGNFDAVTAGLSGVSPLDPFRTV